MSNSNSSSSSSSNGIGLAGMVFIVFLILKLAEIGVVATWSWWWVTAPLWIPFLIVIAILLMIGCAAIIAVCVKTHIEKKDAKKRAERSKNLRQAEAAKRRADKKG